MFDAFLPLVESDLKCLAEMMRCELDDDFQPCVESGLKSHSSLFSGA